MDKEIRNEIIKILYYNTRYSYADIAEKLGLTKGKIRYIVKREECVLAAKKRNNLMLEARKKGSHTKKEWEELKKVCDYTCQMCKKKEPEIKLTKDHIIAISKGGSNAIDNIQPLCLPCNVSKSNI